jgi:transcriptional regulator with XRE-family HTH domain
VSATLAVRRDRFAKHVRRVVAHVRQTKGWTLKQLLETAGVTKPVYYRWVNGEWTEDLEPSPIVRFHDAADWPVSDAWDILWPGKFGRRESTQPVPMTPEMELLLRKLNDPNTSKEDLYLIQATFEMLLSRIAPEGRAKRHA